MRSFKLICPVVLLLCLSACENQSKGFVLPPGDAEAGLAAFERIGCNQCHHIDGKIERATDSVTGIDVRLGGQISKVKTHGDLVTSIINPSHRLSRGTTSMTVTEDGSSRMPSFNATLTVQELVDITMFLQGTYRLTPPEYHLYYP